MTSIVRKLIILILLSVAVEAAAQQPETDKQQAGVTEASAAEVMQQVSELPGLTSSKRGKARTPLFSSLYVGVDAVGPLMLRFSDHGEYQGVLQTAIRGTFLPAIEFGYGKADKYNEDTKVSYKTKAPFGRIGCDYNILKNKHDNYRMVVGLRYGFTSFTYDTTAPVKPAPDPEPPVDPENPVSPEIPQPETPQSARAQMLTRGGTDETEFITTSEKCKVHWAELVFGVDAKIAGPLHMGWSIRYRRRLSASDYVNAPLYAPGFGDASKGTCFMALYTIGLQF